jgi:hypothetical protein
MDHGSTDIQGPVSAGEHWWPFSIRFMTPLRIFIGWDAREPEAFEVALFSLEGWSKRPASGTLKAIHFTRGGPWFEQWQNVDYGDLWLAERDAWKAARP